MNTTVAIRLQYADRNGNTSWLQVYRPSTDSLTQLVAYVDLLRGAIAAISNATLIRYSVRYSDLNTVDEQPPADADCRRWLALFYRNEPEDEMYEALFIPSPLVTLFASEGTLTGIEIDRSAPPLSGFLDGSIVAPLATKEGAIFPATFASGGLVT